MAIAWILARKPWLTPIPATSRTTRIDENLGAVRRRFSAIDLAAFDKAVARVAVTGARYPEHLLAMTGL